MLKYKLHIFHELKEELKDDWLNLELKCDITPFQTYDWFSKWYSYSKINKLGDVLIFVDSFTILIPPKLAAACAIARVTAKILEFFDSFAL